MTRAQQFEALRAELGWSKAETARKLDTYPATVSSWAQAALCDATNSPHKHAQPGKMALAFMRLHLDVRRAAAALTALQ